MAPPKLTAREREVTDLICAGLSNKEIARKLNIAEGTVKVHLHVIYEKMVVRNRTELAMKHGPRVAPDHS